MGFLNTVLLKRYDDLEARLAGTEEPRFEKDRETAGTILLAESDPIELEHLASILRNLRFEVITAEDGRTAWNLVREREPLLILASLDLAGYDGYKLSQLLRESPETEGIPLMLIVNSGQFPDRVIGHETYAHDYIQRPISVPDFKFRLNALLRLARRNRRNGLPPTVRGRFGRPSLVDPLPSGERAGSPGGEGRALPAYDRSKLAAILANVQGLVRELGIQLTDLEKELLEEGKSSPASTETTGGVDRKGVDQPSGFQSSARFAIDLQGEQMSPVGDQDNSAEISETDLGAGAGSEDLNGKDGPDASPPAEAQPQGVDLVEKLRAEYRERAGRGSLFSGRIPSYSGIDDILQAFLPDPERAAAPEEAGRESSAERPDTEKGLAAGDLGIDFSLELLGEPGAEKGAGTPEAPQETREDREERARQEAEQLYLNGANWVESVLQAASRGEIPDLAQARDWASRLREGLFANRFLLMLAMDRDQPYALSNHCVNVALLGLRFASSVGEHPFEFQLRVAIAALVHEVGAGRLPTGLIYNSETLSESELNLLRRRPIHSAQILAQVEAGYSWLSEVVGQVFERPNGLGRPLGLRAGQIGDEAQLLGLIDAFEACVHRRPYREPLTGYRTLYELSTDKTGAFSEELVKGLIQTFSLFPMGEALRLNTGEIVQVVDTCAESLSRPVVQVLMNSAGDPVERGLLKDLSGDPSIRITEVLAWKNCRALGVPGFRDPAAGWK